MRIDIQYRRLAPQDSLRWWIEGQLRQIFAPGAARIRSIEVLLADDTAQGRDILCRVTVRGRRFPEIVVTDRHHHLAALVKSTARRAARRVGQRVSRALGRSAPRETRPCLAGWSCRPQVNSRDRAVLDPPSTLPQIRRKSCRVVPC